MIIKSEFNRLLMDSIFPMKRDKCGTVRHWFARLKICSHIVEEVSYKQYMQELAEELDEMVEASKKPIFNVAAKEEKE